jgi:hypothetical protein
MGYRTNIAIDVDVLTRSIEINIRNKEKNTEKLIKNIQKNMVFIIENLIKISSPGRGRQHKYIHAKKTGGGCMGVQYRLAHRREESEDHK